MAVHYFSHIKFSHIHLRRPRLPLGLGLGLALAAFLWVVAIGSSSTLQAEDDTGKTRAKVTYDDDVRPLLKRRCATCHSGDRTEGDLNIANFLALMQGGGSGAVIDAGSADDSYLFRVVNHDDSPEMPPAGKIPDAEIKLLRDWIDQGALENADSKARKRKPKIDLTIVSANPNARPDIIPALPRLPLEPQLWTQRKSPIRAIAINPWSPIVAIAAPKQVVLFDSKTLAIKGVIPFPGGKPHVLRFSRNGSILLIGGGLAGDSGFVLMWDVAKGQIVRTIGDELDSVLACDITPDHSLVALGGPKKVVRVYSTDDGELVYELTKHTDWVTAIEFSPDGANLASGDRNGGLIVSDARTGNENFDLAGHKEIITSVAWRVDGKILGSVSKDKSVRIWEMRKGKQIKTWPADGEGLTEICFLPEGNLLTAGRDKNVKLWQQDGKQLQTFNGLNDMSMGLAYCAVTERVVAGSFQGEVLVWDRQNPEPMGKLNSNPPPISERIVDIQQQLPAAQQSVNADQDKLQNHDVLMDQIAAETSSIEDRSADIEKKITDAQTKIASTKKNQQAAKTKLQEMEDLRSRKNADDVEVGNADNQDKNDKAKSKQQRKQRKAQRRRVEELAQQLTVLNNQIVAWNGEATGTRNRIADLQKETGRLNDLRKTLAAKLETSRAEVARLGAVLKSWQAEADFASGKK